ncbi:hypothetical protein FVB9288_00027 [Flavobacterium sp. CECT 9288]|nr:hypothetical protein FVB9288_00027 [Flavobacterium sp. CECT 9288]
MAFFIEGYFLIIIFSQKKFYVVYKYFPPVLVFNYCIPYNKAITFATRLTKSAISHLSINILDLQYLNSQYQV